MAFTKFKANLVEGVTEPILRITALATIALVIALIALAVAIGSHHGS